MLKPLWAFTSLHGREVLDLLERMDKVEKERREREKLQRREQKKEETALRRDADKQRKRCKTQPTLQPAPISRGVLVDSAVFNVLTHLTYAVCILSPIIYHLVPLSFSSPQNYPHVNSPLGPTHLPSTSHPAVHPPLPYHSPMSPAALVSPMSARVPHFPVTPYSAVYSRLPYHHGSTLGLQHGPIFPTVPSIISMPISPSSFYTPLPLHRSTHTTPQPSRN